MVSAPRSKTTPTSVPFTRASLDALRGLAVRFNDLQRPLPDHAIVELALRRLYSEYCLFDNDIRATDSESTRLIKKNSRAVLSMRYREYHDEIMDARKDRQSQVRQTKRTA